MTLLLDRIKQAIGYSGLKPSEIAQRSGVSKQVVNGWLSGATKTIRSTHLFPAARTLGVSAEWLSSGKGQMERMDTLTSAESLLIKRYRTLGPKEQGQIDGLIESLQRVNEAPNATRQASLRTKKA